MYEVYREINMLVYEKDDRSINNDLNLGDYKSEDWGLVSKTSPKSGEDQEWHKHFTYSNAQAVCAVKQKPVALQFVLKEPNDDYYAHVVMFSPYSYLN